MSNRDLLAALGDLADKQDGFLSASQAASAGVDRHRLQRLVRQGILERDDRGVYRLALYPQSERAELWRAVLWPSLRRGESPAVVSDGTALGLYDVSTINPATVDVTLPRSLRIRRRLPAGYRLHWRDYREGDIGQLYGLPVTTLFRTLVDLLAERRELQFVDEALENASRRGLLTRKEIDQLRALRSLDQAVIALIR